MDNKINKKDLSDYIAGRYDLKKGLSEDIIQTIFHKITSELKKGNSVNIVGFGSFYNKEYDERISTNPQTGKTFKKGKRVCIKFRLGKMLKNLHKK